MVMKSLAQIAAALEGYDPQALSVPQVQAFLEQLAPLRHDGPVETLPVMAAGERILARDVVSPVDVPPHDNSAMDGFAFTGSDLSATEPTVLQCVGHALAGAAWAGPPPRGSVIRPITPAQCRPRSATMPRAGGQGPTEGTAGPPPSQLSRLQRGEARLASPGRELRQRTACGRCAPA